MSKFLFVTSKVLGQCPAAVYMDTGDIEINKDVWNKYTDFEKQFIIEHERGHYILQTDSEKEADLYALKKMYGTKPQSLKKSIHTLYKVGIIDNNRLKDLYIEALKIDAVENKNIVAINELSNLGITKMNEKKTVGSNPFANTKRRVTGDESNTNTATYVPPPVSESMSNNISTIFGFQTKKTGFEIGEYFISFEVVILAVIVFFLMRK